MKTVSVKNKEGVAVSESSLVFNVDHPVIDIMNCHKVEEDFQRLISTNI